MAVIRAAVMAPFLQLYFPWLSRQAPGTTMPQVLKRVALDQAVGAPVSITMIFSAACLVRGQPEAIVPRLNEQLLPTWASGAMYWPFVHSLNFRFMPVVHHPVVAHVASIWWNVVLSYRANIKLKGEGGDEADVAEGQHSGAGGGGGGGKDAGANSQKRSL